LRLGYPRESRNSYFRALSSKTSIDSVTRQRLELLILGG
jgi:hypothetical protein